MWQYNIAIEVLSPLRPVSIYLPWATVTTSLTTLFSTVVSVATPTFIRLIKTQQRISLEEHWPSKLSFSFITAKLPSNHLLPTRLILIHSLFVHSHCVCVHVCAWEISKFFGIIYHDRLLNPLLRMCVCAVTKTQLLHRIFGLLFRSNSLSYCIPRRNFFYSPFSYSCHASTFFGPMNKVLSAIGMFFCW